jgi:hypothetical protein
VSTYGKILHQQSKQKKIQKTRGRIEERIDARVAAGANTQFAKTPKRRADSEDT